MNRFGPYRLGDRAAMIEFAKIIIAIMLYVLPKREREEGSSAWGWR